jgi:hypothetical protein
MLFLADLISEMMFPHVYRIKHLDTYELAHYAIYEKNQLVKVVILNTHLYTDTTTAPASEISGCVAPLRQ